MARAAARLRGYDRVQEAGVLVLLPLAILGLAALALVLLEVRTLPQGPRPERPPDFAPIPMPPEYPARRRRPRDAVRTSEGVLAGRDLRAQPLLAPLRERAAHAFGRDREVTVFVLAAVAALVVGALVIGAAARGGETTAVPGPAARATSAVETVETVEATAPVTVTATATASATPALATDAGAPYAGSALVSALQARGLTVTAGTGAPSCTNPGAPVRVYQVARAGSPGQRIALIVYPTTAAMQADWASAPRSPLRYLRGECFPGAAVYWNQNLVMTFPEVADPALRQQIADAFLTLGG